MDKDHSTYGRCYQRVPTADKGKINDVTRRDMNISGAVHEVVVHCCFLDIDSSSYAKLMGHKII